MSPVLRAINIALAIGSALFGDFMAKSNCTTDRNSKDGVASAGLFEAVQQARYNVYVYDGLTDWATRDDPSSNQN